MDPKEVLDQKKTDLATKQQTIDGLNKDVTALKTEIQALEAGVTEVQTVVNAYDAARKGLTDDKTKLDAFMADKTQFVKDALDEKVDELDRKIKQFQDDLDTARDDTETAEGDAKKAQEESAALDAAIDEKQRAFVAKKNTKSAAEAAIKDLKDLQKQINARSADSDLNGMYVLLLEAKSVADSTKLPTAADLTTQLNDALQAVSDARDASIAKKSEAAVKKSAAETARKAYDDRLKHRREGLLQAVHE